MSPEALPSPLTPEERQLRGWMRLSIVLYGATLLVFLAAPGLLFEGFNRTGRLVGLPDAPEPTEKFWLSLTISMMAMLCAGCWLVQKDVRRHLDVCLVILAGKFAGALVGVGAFLAWRPYFAHLAIAITDVPLAVITLVLWRRVRGDAP